MVLDIENLKKSYIILMHFYGGYVGRHGCQVPRLVYGENINSNLVLLKEEYAWHLGGALPQHELEEWRLLYHSAINGLSFTTFLGNIT